MASVTAHRLLPWTPLAAALLLVGSQLGCSSQCDGSAGKTLVDVTDGTTDLENGVYESAPWDGTYLEFGAQRRYRFFHGLGGVPRVVQAWIGFVPKPLAPPGPNVSEGVGNEALLRGVTDEYVIVQNDTCARFYLRLVASEPTKPVNE